MADVLSGYGTGAVMAVPARRARPHPRLPKSLICQLSTLSNGPNPATGYHGEGVLVNSGHFDGMASSEAREIVAWLEQEKTGRSKVTYKMRDWLISRQRYWGAPIPIIHCDEHGAVAVPEDQLPVVLPEVKDAPKKDGDGNSVLASVTVG